MGELVVLEEYRRRKEEEEIAELRAELQRIINENDLYTALSKKIIGVVTPSYSKKYDSALVSALSNCFVNTLTRAVDTKSRTVAFAGMFDSVCRAGYDRVIATHIGLQACKKFLNKYGQKFDHVLFFALNAEELSMFESLMPLY